MTSVVKYKVNFFKMKVKAAQHQKGRVLELMTFFEL